MTRKFHVTSRTTACRKRANIFTEVTCVYAQIRRRLREKRIFAPHTKVICIHCPTAENLAGNLNAARSYTHFKGFILARRQNTHGKKKKKKEERRRCINKLLAAGKTAREQREAMRRDGRESKIPNVKRIMFSTSKHDVDK